jgi:hypothetical protein
VCLPVAGAHSMAIWGIFWQALVTASLIRVAGI